MSVLITDNSKVWRRETRFERAAIKILQAKISFKFRRVDKKPMGYGLKSAAAFLLPIRRAD
jgi:hypothetical protein